MSRILVIDDNELVSKLLQESLQEAGYEASVALDANQGYQAALELRPDLILLDVHLPDVMGFELLRVIRNRDELQHIPIIMITGSHHQTEHKVKGFQVGADDYVLKPFEMPELLERIKALLRRSEDRPRRSGSEAPAAPPPKVAEYPKRSEESPSEKSLSVTLLSAILEPWDLGQHYYHGISLFYLVAVSAVVLAALVSAGPAPKPVIVGLAIPTIWAMLTSVLVMVSSIMGVKISWKEGGQLLSLAGVPLLVKMAAAFVFTFWTTLSPFLFSAGPALFLKSPPMWVERIDLFEFWCGVLLWMLLKQRRGSDNRSAAVITGVVWAAVVSLALALGRATGTS